MTFETEPEWMKLARQAPLRSTYDSRQPPDVKSRRAPPPVPKH